MHGNYMQSTQLNEVFTILVQNREYFIHNEFVPFLNKNSAEIVCMVSYIDTDDSV